MDTWICQPTYVHDIFFIRYLNVSRGQIRATNEKAASLTCITYMYVCILYIYECAFVCVYVCICMCIVLLQ